jgi:hypothetical protein
MKKLISTSEFKYLFVAFYLIGGNHLFSQNLPLKSVDKLSVQDLKDDMEETTFNLGEITKYEPKKEITNKIQIENTIVVRYESHARISLMFHKSIKENLLSLRNIKTNQILSGQVIGREIVFKNLQLDCEYEIIENDNIKKGTKIGVVSSSFKKADMFTVSNDFFGKLSSYSMNPGNLTLGTFLAELKECSYSERLAFYQHHALKGKKIDDGLNEGEFPAPETSNISSVSSESSSAGCNCTYVVKAINDFAPGQPWGGNIYSDYSNNWVSDGYSIKAWSNSGAAKWQQLQSGSGFASGDYSWQNGAAGSNATPFYASIAYNLFCTNYPTQIPTDCGCDKGLPIIARYDTKLNTSTNTDGCFWCWGNRGARAAAEDWAVVVEHNIKTGEITPLSGSRAASLSECSSTFNMDFLINLADVVVNVFAVAQKSEPPSGPLATIDNYVKQQKINSLVNSISSLLQTPMVNRVPCGSDEKTLTLLDYRGWRILKANTPTFYTIYSASALRSGGYTKWSSDSRIISQFYLGGILQGGTDVGKEFCCSAPIANWVSHTTLGLPSNRATLQNLLGFYWYGGNNPIVDRDYGVKQGNVPPNCVRLDELRQNSGLSIRQSQDGIYLDNLKDEVVECTISDILGKLIGYYKGESSNKKIWDYANSTNHNGIYIIRVNGKDGVSKTFKIIKN